MSYTCFTLQTTESGEQNNDAQTMDLRQVQADMKKWIGKYHNDLLQKKKSRIRNNCRIFSYIIDEDTLQRKPEQPAHDRLMDWQSYDRPLHSTKDFHEQPASKASCKLETFQRVCRKELCGRYKIYSFTVRLHQKNLKVISYLIGKSY